VNVVYLSLGSNLGDRVRYVQEAIAELKRTSVSLEASSLWITSPIASSVASEDFINAVVRIGVPEELSPLSLLEQTRRIETKFGRPAHRKKNVPRTIDIDLIDFNGRVLNHAELVLPHPFAHERLFVLKPLEELAPDLVLPHQVLSVGELVRVLPPERVEKLNAEPI